MTAPLELAIGIVLAATAVYFVLRPILSPPQKREEPEGTEGTDDGADPADDLSPRTVALRALKEIDFDRATGKLNDADYEALKKKYTAQALAALRNVAETSPTTGRSSAPRHVIACPTHGPPPEQDARFCSECGRRLGDAAGYCARCGSGLEPEARFCARCGVPVAA